MSLSKISDSGVLRIPGVLQRRHNFCCIACGIKDAGVNETFILTLLRSNLTVENLADNSNHVLFEGLSGSSKKAIRVICSNLLDLYGGSAPIMHPSYYQNHSMNLVYHSDGGCVTAGTISRGMILEIFQDGEFSTTTKDILNRLERDATVFKRPRSDQYPNLPYQKMDIVLNVSFKDLELTVSQTAAATVTTYSYNLGDGVADYDTLFDKLFPIVYPIKGVSVIEVNTCNSRLPGIPLIMDWINFVSMVYGNLDSIILVFIVAYPDILAQGIKGKKEVRATINYDIKVAQSEKIWWMDVAVNGDGSSDSSGGTRFCLNRLPVNKLEQ